MPSKKIILLVSVVFIFAISFFNTPTEVKAQDNTICAVYFTGIGCPHCSKTDPVLFEELLDQYPNLFIIEYEIYNQQENGTLLYSYNQEYNSGLGIPLVIFNKETNFKGDRPILNNANKFLNKNSNNKCLLLDGSAVDFASLDIAALHGLPKIWHQNKILIKQKQGANDSQLLRDLLINNNIDKVLDNKNYNQVESISVHLSGKSLSFDHAINLGNWLFQWNGESSDKVIQTDVFSDNINQKNSFSSDSADETNKLNLTWTKIISLAVVDAVNPCALAVLVLMLTAILAYNPSNRKNIILAGLAFIFSIYIMYLFYGLVIIKFFKVVQALTVVRLWLYKILGIIAIILAILNIRDFLKYKPGQVGTEMPLFLRPKVQKIISGVTSIKGAFGVGIFVTLFLLPCTIGPYIIAGGILSALEVLQTLPPLFLYNLIFISPMLIIVAIVYIGFRKVEDINNWKEKNITKLHLVAGIIMLFLGLVMIMGWV